MTIELQTGLPGACKTQYTLWRVEALRKQTGRPVFYSGIPINKDKLPDWQEIDGEKWYTAPPESIVIIDEAQRIFRPRANGSKVPEYESHLETHRHGGIDLVLITQGPKLVSSHVRDLVGGHYHAVRHWGMQVSTIHKWSECRVNVQNRKDSIASKFKFRKEVFGWYKSAEAHTIKRDVPLKVYAFLALPVVLGFLVYLIWGQFHGRMHPESVAAGAGAASGPIVPGAMANDVGSRVLSPRQYVDSYTPRVPGLAYTAPVYDKVTQPTKAPYPAACVQGKSRCQCYSQQATKLDVPSDMCVAIAQGGFFLAWDERRGRGDLPAGVPVRPAVAPASAASDALGGPVALTTSSRWQSLQLAANDALFGKAADNSASDGSALRSMRDATPASPAAEPPPEHHAHLRSQ